MGRARRRHRNPPTYSRGRQNDDCSQRLIFTKWIQPERHGHHPNTKVRMVAHRLGLCAVEQAIEAELETLRLARPTTVPAFLAPIPNAVVASRADRPTRPTAVHLRNPHISTQTPIGHHASRWIAGPFFFTPRSSPFCRPSWQPYR